jgi:hypothetical protein
MMRCQLLHLDCVIVKTYHRCGTDGETTQETTSIEDAEVGNLLHRGTNNEDKSPEYHGLLASEEISTRCRQEGTTSTASGD